MNDINARPGILKQVNLSLIRKAIKNKGEVTRAEIAWETKISSTTIRTLLSEMLENNEIECVGHAQSTGGRKAERYRFNPDCYYGVAFCIMPDLVHGILVNLCGDIVETATLQAIDGNIRRPMAAYLDEQLAKREIKAIGLGVSGVVESTGYLYGCADDGMRKDEIGAFFARRYNIPIVLENNMNAITIGFGRCYQKQYRRENPENTNMAFLYFVETGISAGFIAGGRSIRGWNNYAGELGLIFPDGRKSLGEYMAEPMDDTRYAKLITKIICWTCGILNPQYVALGGPGYRHDCHGLVSNTLSALLPHKMLPEILYSPDVLHDYFEGMAYLTASKIFDDILLVKET